MRHLSWSNTGNCVVKTCSPKFNLCVWFITHLNICVCSPRNSPWQLVIAECFAKVSSVFYSNHLGKIYIQFIIFSTYFSTKLWFKNKKYHLHVLEKCLRATRSQINDIFGNLFILFLFVHVAMEQALLSRHILESAKFCNVTFVNNFYFVSFFYHLFIKQNIYINLSFKVSFSLLSIFLSCLYFWTQTKHQKVFLKHNFWREKRAYCIAYNNICITKFAQQ